MPEPNPLLASVGEYLAEPRCAVLSTIGADGAPHQAVVHCILEGDGLVVNGRSDRRWAANLRRDPRVSVVIHDADRPLHWVGIRAACSTYERVRRRVSFRILPRRVFEYG